MNLKESFLNTFETLYDQPMQTYDDMTKAFSSALERNESAGASYPQVANVRIGETIPGSLIVFFMDIRGFTNMSIALENDELVKILQAITAASIISIIQYSGYVAEFTGDGVMAYFGNGSTTSETDAYNSLSACSYLMNGIKEVVNKYLDKLIDETVRVGMGIEYGNIIWTRIGLPERSQIKPISEITFVAGKNSSRSNSWEVLMGKNISDWITDEYKEKFEPISFQKDKKQYIYERFLLNWQKFYKDNCEHSDTLAKTLTARRLPTLRPRMVSGGNTISSITQQANTVSGPRPLKDQPFFL